MLAELSGMGETYYRSIFLAVFNMPPAHYIQLYRVGKAKELLLSDDMKIYEVADTLGFESAYYFSKVFKKVVGLSPREFIQSKIEE
jgi:two-component system response regulator YesN